MFGRENRHLGSVSTRFHAFRRPSVKAKLLVRTNGSLHGSWDTAFQAETGRMDAQETTAHPFGPCEKRVAFETVTHSETFMAK